MKNENTKKTGGAEYQVPPGGSLGLLALGYRGWVAWRDALKKYIEENNDKQKNGKKEG